MAKRCGDCRHFFIDAVNPNNIVPPDERPGACRLNPPHFVTTYNVMQTPQGQVAIASGGMHTYPYPLPQTFPACSHHEKRRPEDAVDNLPIEIAKRLNKDGLPET